MDLLVAKVDSLSLVGALGVERAWRPHVAATASFPSASTARGALGSLLLPPATAALMTRRCAPVRRFHRQTCALTGFNSKRRAPAKTPTVPHGCSPTSHDLVCRQIAFNCIS